MGKMQMRPAWLLACLSAFMLLMPGCARQAQDFPAKPITIVVPWDAGGGTDALARSIANQSSEFFGVQLNVLNRPGGSGAVGHSYGITARPDGYTVTMITYELCTYRPLGRVPIGPENYKAIIQLNEDPAAITVHADSEWQTLQDFLNYARENPGEVTIGNSGPGAVWHIGALKLESAADVSFTHVPHNGAKPAVTQLLGRHIDAVSVSPAEVLQYVQEGTLRCLGVMSEERMALLPQAPTFREHGIDLVHGTWRGLAAPPETDDAIAAQLEEGFTQGYQSEAFQETAEQALLGLRYRDSQAFDRFLQEEANSVATLLEDTPLAQQAGTGGVGPGLFPAIMGIGLAVSLLAMGLRKILMAKQAGQPPNSQPSPRLIWGKPAIALLATVIYALLMINIGYVASTLLYLVFLMAFLGERSPARMAVSSVVVVALIVLVFKTLLDVPLPVFWGQ